MKTFDDLKTGDLIVSEDGQVMRAQIYYEGNEEELDFDCGGNDSWPAEEFDPKNWELLDGYVYHSTERPIDIGTFPAKQDVDLIVNFDQKHYVCNIGDSYGYLIYNRKLEKEEQEAYELSSYEFN